MHLTEGSVNALQYVITGNETPNGEMLAPYRSGPQLVEFFNGFGLDTRYGRGFPSRHVFAKDALRELQGTDQLRKAVESAFLRIHFIDSKFLPERAAEYVNQYLEYDGYQLAPTKRGFRVTDCDESLVEIENENWSVDPLAQEFIEQQIYKCQTKIQNEDYDGAITNARSLLESVLGEIEQRLVEDAPEPDGNLGKLFKRVQKELNLEPGRTDVSGSLKQVLSGLTSIVHGIAPIRNCMSDAHRRTYKPAKHHARLAVNASQSACDFLIQSYHYQVEKGYITPLNTVG